MQTVLFHEIIFGPIHSRRLGISLGVNLLPVDGKLCSFDCVYCECGYNAQGVGKSGLPSSDRVEEELKSRLQSIYLVFTMCLHPVPSFDDRIVL